MSSFHAKVITKGECAGMLFTEQNDIYNVMWINFQTVKTLRSYITHFLGG